MASFRFRPTARMSPAVRREARVGDYFALLKPRVMSLVVFTALVGLLVAPGRHPSVHRLRRDPLHRHRGGCLRRPEHVVRCRYRRGMSRTAEPPVPSGRVEPREALAFGLTLLGLLGGACSGLATNWLAAGAAGLHDLLLRRRLHDVAEALDAAEHRHRRRRRGLPADDRLGRGDRHVSLELLLFLIIFMWTPPHFWALALFRAATTPRPACRCCRRCRRAQRPRSQILIRSHDPPQPSDSRPPNIIHVSGSLYGGARPRDSNLGSSVSP